MKQFSEAVSFCSLNIDFKNEIVLNVSSSEVELISDWIQQTLLIIESEGERIENVSEISKKV